MKEIPRRKREGDGDYRSRVLRWESRKRVEPLVDLFLVPDDEVAEYRRWAGTYGVHNKIVEDMVKQFS